MRSYTGASSASGASSPWLRSGLPADVRLVFGDASAGHAERRCDPLPVHSQVLGLASPVLREALALAKPGADGVKDLPVGGDQPEHWKLVLSVLYDGLVRTGGRHDEQLITWKNAEALATLADKYDMACLRDAVDRFASSAPNWDFGRADALLLWLGIASRCGLPRTFRVLLAMVEYGAGPAARPGKSCRRPAIAPSDVLRGLDYLTPRDTRALLLALLGYGG